MAILPKPKKRETGCVLMLALLVGLAYGVAQAFNAAAIS